MDFTQSQLSIINAPIKSICVTACAGSGKTRVAVQRIAEIRKRLSHDRTFIALLSFSNIAVDTFLKRFLEISKNEDLGPYGSRVSILTLDSFFSQNVLLPYGHLVMGCQDRPFILSDYETKKHLIYDENSRAKHNYNDLKVELIDNSWELCLSKQRPISRENYQNIKKFLKTGAYTHELGRWVVYQVLKQNPKICRALSHRYKHIYVDEAQDISDLQAEILSLLIKEGSQVSLIGDPWQAIYSFTGAYGDMLHNYKYNPSITQFCLNENFRSTKEIQNLAKHISNITDHTIFERNNNVLFAVTYNPDNIYLCIDNFNKLCDTFDIEPTQRMAIARSKDLVSREKNGQGCTKRFINALIARDINHDIQTAYIEIVNAICHLTDINPLLGKQLLDNSTNNNVIRTIKSRLWLFLRTELPNFTNNQANWLSEIKENLHTLLVDLSKIDPSFNTNLKSTNKIRQNNLDLESIFNATHSQKYRITTVHQVKGDESDAVLYFCKKAQLNALVKREQNEENRINYVAITRAKKLFCLAVPENLLPEHQKLLRNLGFSEYNTQTSNKNIAPQPTDSPWQTCLLFDEELPNS